jgi:branched-chain amino acid transport system substrate-binding protein
MKRFLVTLGVLLCLALPLCAQEQITIGVNLPTTGSGASLGIPEKNALIFAPQVIAGHKVRYVVYDDASDSTTALQNVKRLLTEDKIDLLLGPGLTTNTLGVIDTIAEAKVPMFALASATQLVYPVDAKRRWVFKTPANDSVYNSTMVKHMVKKGVKSASVIATDDPYGESNTMEFKKLADENNIKVLTVEKYKRTDTSVTGQVLRAMQGNPDAVFIIAVGTVSALPQLTLTERGYKGKVYHTGSVANADFLRVGGKGIEGAYVPTSPFIVAEQLPDKNPTKAEALKFIQAYEAKYGSRAHFAAQMYDALHIVEAAAQRALKTTKPGTPEFREALRTEIENTKGFKGTSAVYNFSATEHAGIDTSSMCVVRVENGAWKLEP